MKKALVISGGGSKGAFAGGVVQHLINNNKKDYDLFIGTVDNISENDLEVSPNAISDFRITFTDTNVFDKLY